MYIVLGDGGKREEVSGSEQWCQTCGIHQV